MPRTVEIVRLAGRLAVFVVDQGESRGNQNERARDVLRKLAKHTGSPCAPRWYFKDGISMMTLCRDIAQARLLEEAEQPRWRPL